jgi:hypothetical protein
MAVAAAIVSFSKLYCPKQCYCLDYQHKKIFTLYEDCYIFSLTLLNRAMNKIKNFFPSLLPFNVFFGKWRAILALISFAILALIKMFG